MGLPKISKSLPFSIQHVDDLGRFSIICHDPNMVVWFAPDMSSNWANSFECQRLRHIETDT